MTTASKWKKLGLIFCPQGETSWMQSHAAVPTAEHLHKDLFKIYFSTRDQFNRSSTAYVVIDITQPNKILELSSQPVLSPGALGAFDDSGAMPTWITQHEETKYLYYIGWNLGTTVPFRNSIGLAVSHGNDKFQRYADGPILDRSLHEPHFCATCCVLPDKNVWRMWYQSCTGWEKHEDQLQHKYHIKYAESHDGIVWKREGIISIDFANQNEYAICRPSVIRKQDLWRMWYCFRGQTYRIGYAESTDGRKWNRLDHQVGIDVSKTGWDSESLEYPYVFEHANQTFMLYNGNNYGRTGFGLAVLD